MFFPVLFALTYQTNFTNCPVKSVGNLSLELVAEFEKKRSLYQLKKMILNQGLDQKYFIESYEIEHDWGQDKLKLDFWCPKVIMLAQIYKEDMADYYSALLVDNGKLYDPVYADLLKEENKLVEELPFLSIPVSYLDGAKQLEIARLYNYMNLDLKKEIAEIVLTGEGELVFIVSHLGESITVYMGKENWDEGVIKLSKIISFLEKKESIPSIISLRNLKKVVVKFDTKS